MTEIIQRNYNDYSKPKIISTRAISSSPIKTVGVHSGVNYVLLQSGQVLQWNSETSQVNLFGPLKGISVSKLKADGVFLTDDGELYFVSDSPYEKFGRFSSQADPDRGIREIKQGDWKPQNPSERITNIACCFSSCVVITDEVNVYFLGQHFWFIPRSPDTSQFSSFRLPIEEQYRIVGASGGYFHASLLLSNGDVWVTGENSESCKLGVEEPGGITFYNLAQCNNLTDKFIIAESAINYSVFVTESNVIYLAGDIPSKPKGTLTTPSLYKLDFEPRTLIVCVSISYDRMFVGTLDGLYTNNPSFLQNGTIDNEVSEDKPLVEIKYTAEHTSTHTAVVHSSGSFDAFYTAPQPIPLIKRHFRKQFRGFEDKKKETSQPKTVTSDLKQKSAEFWSQQQRDEEDKKQESNRPTTSIKADVSGLRSKFLEQAKVSEEQKTYVPPPRQSVQAKFQQQQPEPEPVRELPKPVFQRQAEPEPEPEPEPVQEEVQEQEEQHYEPEPVQQEEQHYEPEPVQEEVYHHEEVHQEPEPEPEPEQEQYPKYKAMYDFDATDPEELTFAEGDILIVLKSEGDWWTAAHVNNPNTTGFIPANYIEPL